MDKHTKDIPSTDVINLPRKSRYLMFVIFLGLSFSQSMDQGAVAGNTKEIKRHFHIDDLRLGTLGSIVFIGNTIGCILTFCLINRINRKYLMLIASTITCINYFIFTQIKFYPLILLCRFLSGMTQSYNAIYLPVWCDQFGIYKNRALFIALGQIVSPLGYISGYVISMMIHWRTAYFVSLSLLMFHVVMIMFVNKQLFSSTLMPLKRKQAQLLLNSNSNNNDAESTFEEIEKTENNNVIKTICKEFVVCFKSIKFVMLNLTLIFIYYVVSAIQFWINDYLEVCLKIEEKEKRLILFASIIITSPILGIILGGVIIKSIFGGYDKPRAIFGTIIFALIVTIFANFVVLTSNTWIFAISLWIYLFFGSMMLPGLNGMVLSSIPKEFAGNANSLSTLLYNVFGKFPSPNVYGYIKDKAGRKFHGKLPMMITVNVASLGLISLIVLAVITFNQINRKLHEKIIYDVSDEDKTINETDINSQKCKLLSSESML